MNSIVMHTPAAGPIATVEAKRQRLLAALRPQRAAQLRIQAQAAAGSRIAWLLFIVLNGLVVMRPAEIVPQLEHLPLYEVSILLCIISAMPAILGMFQSANRAWVAVTVCVVGMLFAILASTLPHGDLFNAQEQGVEYAKVVVYFILLLALMDTPVRIRQLLAALVVYTLILNVIAMLSFYHLIHLATVQPMEELQFSASRTAKRVLVERMQAAGIYGNPNDLARIIVVALTICLFFVLRKSKLPVRLVWIILTVFFMDALALTFSRGGLLALMAGIVILLHARYGMRKGAFLLLLLLPVLIVFGGRQTDISTSSGTGQLRVKLWSNGLVALRESPLFGIGAGHYFHTAGNHAHNSFVEAFVETGLFGGTLFTSAFYLVTTTLFAFNKPALKLRAPELFSLRPYILSSNN